MGSIIITGVFKNNPVITLNNTSVSFTSQGSQDAFALKIQQFPTGIIDQQVQHSFQAYPNPNSGLFFINSSVIESGFYTIKVISSTGQVIYNKNIFINEFLSERINIPMNGVYYIELWGKGYRSIKKVIVNGL